MTNTKQNETPRLIAERLAAEHYAERRRLCADAIEAALNAERERAFTQGYVCACANIMNLHGEDVIAREVLNANRPDDWSIIDPLDRKALQPIFDHEKAQAAIRGKD